jgi:hypothetical protein
MPSQEALAFAIESLRKAQRDLRYLCEDNESKVDPAFILGRVSTALAALKELENNQ